MMVRTPRSGSCEVLNKGAWTASEDKLLMDYVRIHGEGRWSRLSRETGLKRCGKSCRLRWLNYLRPNIKRGNISDDEEELIIRLHKLLGNRWSLIAGRLPGRTDNEIKNYWNTNIAKKKPELLLPRTVTINKNRPNSYSNPRGNDAYREPKQEQTNNADTIALQQTNEIKQIHVPKLALNEGLSMGDEMLVKRMMPSDSDYLSDGSLSLMSSPEYNPNDFMIGFTVDDICQILEVDFTGLDDVNLRNEDDSNIDYFINDCRSGSPAGEYMGAGQFREAEDVGGVHLLESFFGPDNEDEKGVGIGIGGQSDNRLIDEEEVNLRDVAGVQPVGVI